MAKAEPDPRRTIGRIARRARVVLELTQAEVAEAIGLAPENYSRLERGLLNPSLSTLVQLARVLDVTPNELLGWAQPNASARILSLLSKADDVALRRAEAVLRALLSAEPKKK